MKKRGSKIPKRLHANQITTRNRLHEVLKIKGTSAIPGSTRTTKLKHLSKQLHIDFAALEGFDQFGNALGFNESGEDLEEKLKLALIDFDAPTDKSGDSYLTEITCSTKVSPSRVEVFSP